MLYAFFGTDIAAARQKAHDFLEQSATDGVVRISIDNLSPTYLREVAGGASLFGETSTYLIDTPSEDAGAYETVLAEIAMLAESPHVFVLLEGAVRALDKKKIAKHAQQCIELMAQKKDKFNVFALSDALLRRDKKSLWLLLIAARNNGIADEQIIGLLGAALRSMRLAQRVDTAEKAGIPPFVFTKARRALTFFSADEPDRLTGELTELYHQGHAGIVVLDFALERWVLTL